MDILNYNPTVLTKRGIIPESEVTYGDILFEYGTGNPLEVDGVEEVHPMESYLVKYNDTREIVVSDNDYIFTGNHIMKVEDLQPNIEDELKPQVLNFNRPPEFFIEDPYVAGALLTYGNLESEFVSIRSDKLEIMPDFEKAVGLHATSTSGNYTYFKRTPLDSECWRWDDYFPRFDVYPSMQFPLMYLYGDVHTRTKFLQGVFDFGYNPDITPDSINIVHNNKNVLDQIRLMLWSLGEFPLIEQIPILDNDSYLLEILSNKYTTKYFKYSPYITSMLLTDKRVVKLDPPFVWKVYAAYGGVRLLADVRRFHFHLKHHSMAVFLNGHYCPIVGSE